MSDFPAPARLSVTSDRVVTIKGSIRPRPYYSRGDTQRLVAGETTVTVTFNTPVKDTSWVFAGLTFVNYDDAEIDVVHLEAIGRIQKSQSGFQLRLNAPPPTDNYYLDWSIAEKYNP